jgi:hypothetical protein
MQQPTKICTACKTPKPLPDFRRETYSADGRRPYCKDCEKAKERSKKAERAEYGKKYFDF